MLLLLLLPALLRFVFPSCQSKIDVCGCNYVCGGMRDVKDGDWGDDKRGQVEITKIMDYLGTNKGTVPTARLAIPPPVVRYEYRRIPE